MMVSVMSLARDRRELDGHRGAWTAAEAAAAATEAASAEAAATTAAAC